MAPRGSTLSRKPTPSDRRPSVLLVMAPGPGRRSAAEALRGAGYRVRSAREPFEGTARFVERPAELVVLSLERFRGRDIAFLQAVKRRAPTARILLLVPEGRRATALQALRAGADAYVREPFYPEELAALAGALLAERRGEDEPAAGRSVGRLAGEVAHAINNPLQILALLGESEGVPAEVRTGLEGEVGRIRTVVRILSRFGLLRPPQRGVEAVGRLLRQSLEGAAREGLVQLVGPPVEDGPEVPVDSSQAGVAFDGLLAFLAGRANERPLPVSARLRRLPAKAPTAVEAAVRGRGVFLEAAALETLRETVLLSRDDTREVIPGLALVDAIVRNHGGRLVARPSDHGTVLGLRFPLEV